MKRPSPAPGYRMFQREILPACAGAFAMNVFFGWLTLRGTDEIPLSGARSILADLVPATFMSIVMLTLITTLIARRRPHPLDISPHPGRTSRLPHQLILRAVMLGAIATITLAPVIAGSLVLWSPARWSWASFLWFKLGFSVLLTVAGLPPIIQAILAHDLPARQPPRATPL